MTDWYRQSSGHSPLVHLAILCLTRAVSRMQTRFLQDQVARPPSVGKHFSCHVTPRAASFQNPCVLDPTVTVPSYRTYAICLFVDRRRCRNSASVVTCIVHAPTISLRISTCHFFALMSPAIMSKLFPSGCKSMYSSSALCRKLRPHPVRSGIVRSKP